MTINNIATNQLSDAMTRIATGQRINSAADDASGLAIMEKMEAQIKGLEQGNDNSADMQNLIKTAEGGLSTINDSLLRIRELSVQAANGIYGEDDVALMQNEVSQMLDHVKSVTASLQFNNKNLLDGSSDALHTASYANGDGMTVGIPDIGSLLNNLEGYNLNNNIDIGALDEALSAVSGVRAELGAMSNRLDHTINSNSITILNQMAAKSRIADADIGKSVMDMHKDRILNEMQLFSQRSQMEQMQNGPLSLLR